MSFSETLNAARLRAGAILRERRERAAEKKAEKAAHTPGGAVPALWVWFLGAIAVCTLLGSTWMLVVFIAGSVGHVDWSFDWRAGNDGQPPRWIWSAEANIHALIGVGLFLACAGVAMYNAVWLHVREHIRSLLFRRVILAIGIAVAFFMVSGAIVTQQWGTDARTRDEVAGVQTAQAGVAAVDAEIASIETEMGRLCAPNLTTWQAQACRSGEQAWNDRIGIARTQMRENDPQFQIIARAVADARQGDRWRARLTQLRGQRAVAAVTTVTASVAEVRATGWFADFTHVLEDLRKPFIAVLGELLAMTMFGVALEAHRSRQPYRVHPKESGWADDLHQIEDMTAQEPIASQPMKPAREVVTDAETGEEMVKVKPHWRKLKKGRPQQVQVTPEPEPDEVGVPPERDGRDAELRSSMHQPVEEWSATALKVAVEDAPQVGEDEQSEADGDSPAPALNEDEDGGGNNGQAAQDDSGSVQSSANIQGEPPEPDFTDEALQSINALVEDEPQPASDAPDASGDAEAVEDHLAPLPYPENALADERANGEAGEQAEQEPEQEHHDTTEPARSPETDPARLIASVAAE